ncbi:right-handed parallel beta-helix repeat-containing protein [Pedobacter rhizosphaerae]|uniref:Right handed beta helix region n=1 Tax=Pedobacter rhizosphaerae TaxID=390241 RepID=A0A1H9U056_9SPHI|nr:right-handed parallel beta-helix repeat-containing protein [Pedobacter rhizosphaerae]SES02739.1 Right handed beta helix region [Pedobacter rhizosphaerae]
MKKKSQLLILALSLVLLSCKKETEAEGSTFDTNKTLRMENQTASVSDLTINTGMTLAQINQVIAAAVSGDTVWVEAGTYTITGRIVMKAGVILAKKTSTNPIFDATGTTTDMLSVSYNTELNNCVFSGITFWNYRFVITNASKVTFKYCIFDYGTRKAGTNETYYSDAYLQFNDTDSSVVNTCTFARRVNNSGRGVWLKSTTNSKILNCTFGNGGTTGYFVTAINDNSESNSLINNNIINRNIALNTDLDQTDHGIYAHSFNGLTISGNTISGWPANGSGGSVKARNGQNVTISGNTFNDSGILLYEYSNTPAYPYLNNVIVLNNTINITTNVNDIYHGIGYYRDNTTGTEYSFRIEGNIVPNGTISFAGNNINVTNFNAANGGVYNNDYGILSLKAGINQSGNY